MENFQDLAKSGRPADWLRTEYLRRKEKNPRYSLRAFAKYLQLSPGSLAGLVAATRPLTAKMAQRLCEELGYSPKEREALLTLVMKDKVCRAGIPTSVHYKRSEYKLLEEDSFLLISEWYHLALLTLMETKSFRSQPQWIANRLGVTTTEVRQALERLERLRLTSRHKDTWKSNGNIKTKTDIPSSAFRKYHRQSLEKAIESLDRVPVAERDITAITIALNPAKLGLAKELIKKFRRNLAEILSEDPKETVYQLNIQLFPLVRSEP